MRDDTATGNGSLDQGVELFVTADGELQVARGHSLHLKVLAGVAGELEDLSGEVLEDGRSVDGGRGANAAAGADSALQEPVDSSDRELRGRHITDGLDAPRGQQRGLRGPHTKRLGILPGVQRGRTSTGGSSCSWSRTCLPFLLFLLCLQPRVQIQALLRRNRGESTSLGGPEDPLAAGDHTYHCECTVFS